MAVAPRVTSTRSPDLRPWPWAAGTKPRSVLTRTRPLMSLSRASLDGCAEALPTKHTAAKAAPRNRVFMVAPAIAPLLPAGNLTWRPGTGKEELGPTRLSEARAGRG